ncbi:aminotransferase, class I and II [Actibacterium atlanticum]|uniref:cysteine-S-conjugate beta-lyase n=1 Tax=Actibacterium atlanticum TaxID=1461693 RepID=A0A058ZLW8_9RHOB|nr:MalY/PatB family protein [Actibacterium atlanticum]KCV82195.1 aminotransferase, class I and II [Actibacterium atlanticum]
MNFDEIIDRRNTHSLKWDGMEERYGVSPGTGLPMWVADMDFRPPQGVSDALRKMADHGVYGYYGDDTAYRAAICWWMENRHGWQVDPKSIFTTHGLVNAVGLCLNSYTQPGDGIVLFTPVYHAFARTINAAGRKVVECPLALVNGQYKMDFAAYDAQMTGAEKMVILCSPHNPGGRVWTREELQGVADFCKRHDLLLVSDEIHHDLVFGGHKHIAMPLVDPSIQDRLILLTAASKTFNIAGTHTGNVIITDPTLRRKFAGTMMALGLSPNSFGLEMVTAAYSPEGAAWVDALVEYLDENRRLFDAAINAIPGLQSMPLQATYLAWVDFSATGITMDEALKRVEKSAQIAVNHGPTFGRGGEGYLRFNFAMPRAQIEQAISRLQDAFADLQ